jgi:DNA-binding response OmpR family regulator
MNQPTGLIVEDDHDLSSIFTQALKTAGYKTEVCKSGPEALDKLALMTPHLVVLDLHLPGISGVEVLRQINADQRFAGMRVVITTADVQLAETLRDAADLILLKPVSYRQLADLASRFLQMLE